MFPSSAQCDCIHFPTFIVRLAIIIEIKNWTSMLDQKKIKPNSIKCEEENCHHPVCKTQNKVFRYYIHTALPICRKINI